MFQYKKYLITYFLCIAILCNCFFTKLFGQGRQTDSLIHWIQSHPKIDSQYIITLHRISYRYSETDVNQSFIYFEKAAYLSDSMNFTSGKALAQINLGILLNTSANFEGSNNAYFKAIEYAEKSGFLRLKSVSLNNIGDNFFTLKDYDKCRQYTQEAIDINMQLQQWRGVAINYELLGRCDFAEKKYAAAQENFKKGLPYGLKSVDPYILSQLYNDFGMIQAVAGNTVEANYYFDKALKMAQQDKDLRNEHLVFMAQAKYLQAQSVDEKLKSLYIALDIAQKTSFLEGEANAAQELSNTYDRLEKKDSSLRYYRIYRSASDSLFSENNKRNVIIKESEWRIKRKDIENGHLKDVAEIQRKELNFKNGLLLASILVLVLGIAVAFLIHNNSQHRKKQEFAQQKQKDAELNNQLNEMEFKAFKAQLNPHFIFNYLNSISGYILQSQPEKASNMIVRFSKMLRNVLTNSELNMVSLPEDINTIKQYLQLMHEIATPPFRYEISVCPLIQKDQSLMVPPLFIQPYIENAILHGLKHAEGNNLLLQIDYKKIDTALQIKVIDNGIGFNQKDAVRKKIMQAQSGEIHLGLGLTEKRIKGFCDKQGYTASIVFSVPFAGLPQPGTEVTILIDGIFR